MLSYNMMILLIVGIIVVGVVAVMGIWFMTKKK
jgi:hypothetical protein